MAKNLKALTQSEVDYLNSKYDFEDVGKYIIVKSKNGYGVKTAHDADKSFILLTPIRKITISKEAIDLWRTEFKDSSLIDIQSAITTLTLTYQDTTNDDIDQQLKRGNGKIKII